MGKGKESQGAGISRRELLAAGLGWLGAGWALGAAADKALPAKKKRFACQERTLLDEGIGNPFIDEGTVMLGQWEALATPQRRIEALWRVVNAALERVGIPIVQPPVVGVLKKPLGAVFKPRDWGHIVDPEKFMPAQLSREAGIAVLGFVYHEARHVEQFWLMGRWRALKGTKTVRTLLNDVGIATEVARVVLGCPLPRHSPLEPQIATWFHNYQTDMMREHNRLIETFQQEGSRRQKEGLAANNQRTEAEERALDRYHSQALQEDAERAGDWLIMLIKRRESRP